MRVNDPRPRRCAGRGSAPGRGHALVVGAVLTALVACGTGPVRGAPAAAATSANADPVPAGSDAQAESLLVDVRSLDSTIAVSMRYATADNFTGAPLPGYGANRALLRREAAVALARVQARLRPRGLGLLVFDAYRPARASEAMVAWTRRAEREDLLRDGYIASRSRHNLGQAIDLTLVDLATGKEVDMGTPFDAFTPAAHTANASGDVAHARALLVEAMAAEGFVNYAQEWWHFSFETERPLRFDRVIH